MYQSVFRVFIFRRILLLRKCVPESNPLPKQKPGDLPGFFFHEAIEFSLGPSYMSRFPSIDLRRSRVRSPSLSVRLL